MVSFFGVCFFLFFAFFFKFIDIRFVFIAVLLRMYATYYCFFLSTLQRRSNAQFTYYTREHLVCAAAMWVCVCMSGRHICLGLNVCVCVSTRCAKWPYQNQAIVEFYRVFFFFFFLNIRSGNWRKWNVILHI